MLDRHLRPLVDNSLERAARGLVALGIGPASLTLAGLVAGLMAASAIAAGWSGAALLLLLLSRLMDGLDGPAARLTHTAPIGGYLDIMADFTIWAALPLGFAFLDPSANALAAALLLASFFINGASFLGFAILAEVRQWRENPNGEKAHYHDTGLIEGSETIAFFILVMIWPAAFAWLAPAFALLTALTAGARVLRAMRRFQG